MNGYNFELVDKHSFIYNTNYSTFNFISLLVPIELEYSYR